MTKRFYWKIAFLIVGVCLLIYGGAAVIYYSSVNEFQKKISLGDNAGAQSFLKDWETSRIFWLVSKVPHIGKMFIYQRAWLAANLGETQMALRGFRELSSDEFLKSRAIYNSATIALSGGKESLDKIAEDYIKVLKKDPDDFQAKVNLEIIRLLQKQEAQQGQGKEGKQKKEQKGQGKKAPKKFKMDNKEGGGGGDNRTRF